MVSNGSKPQKRLCISLVTASSSEKIFSEKKIFFFKSFKDRKECIEFILQSFGAN